MDEARQTPTPSRDFLTTLRRRYVVVLEVAVAITIAAALTAQVKTPVYRATAMIALMAVQQKGEDRIPTPPATAEQSDPKLQVRRITSAAILDRVRLNLDLGPAFDLRSAVTTNLVESSQNSSVVAISAKDNDPLRAQKIADEVANVFAGEAETGGVYATERALKFVEEQMTSMREQLSVQESAIENFKRNHPPESQGGDAGAATRLARVVSLQSELESLDTQMKEVAGQLHQTTAQLATTPEKLSVEQMVPNPMTNSLRQQITQLEVERTAKLAEYTDNSPEIRQLEQQIRNLKRMLAGEKSSVIGEVQEALNPVRAELESRRAQLEFTLTGLQARKSALERLRAQHRSDVATLPAQQTEVARLERKRSILESLYNMLQSRYYELQIAKAQQPRTVEILQQATEPTSPVEPNKVMYYAVGLVLGLILGLVLAGLVDHFDDTFADADELERLLGLPVLGVVPLLEGEEVGTALIRRGGGPFSDGIHMVFTNTRFLSPDAATEMLSVTGTAGGDGATTLAANLAIAMAQSGNDVLLVDGNWRTPSLHRLWGEQNPAPGLAEVITGEVALEAAVRATGVPGLRLLCAGTVPPNPATVLASKQAAEIFERLATAAQFVVVDSSAVATAPESAILATHAAGTILVTDRLSRRQNASLAVRAVRRAGGRIVGAVRNRERLAQFRTLHSPETPPAASSE
jgi:polysaccharide biosynthesis transport protein